MQRQKEKSVNGRWDELDEETRGSKQGQTSQINASKRSDLNFLLSSSSTLVGSDFQSLKAQF